MSKPSNPMIALEKVDANISLQPDRYPMLTITISATCLRWDYPNARPADTPAIYKDIKQLLQDYVGTDDVQISPHLRIS